MKNGIVAILYIVAVTVSIVTLVILVHVMDINNDDNLWSIVGANSKDGRGKNGIDRDTSFGKFTEDDKAVRKFCRVPKPTVLYPLCEAKVQYVHTNWKLRCFAEENNIDNRDLCSILIYLSEIEKWCPRLTWRETYSTLKTKQSIVQKTKVRSNVDYIIENILNYSDYKWMQNRIKSMEKDWKRAILSLSKKRNLSNRSKKKILVYPGQLSYSPVLLSRAFSGGPLGELVQWSDIITSLHLLGHDVTFAKNEKEAKRFIPLPDGNGCINKDILRQFEFDLLYTDIAGAILMMIAAGPGFSLISCKLRILDSFGTEAEFNVGQTSSNWGGLKVNLRQFMTMYPHSPDNSFIGFVSGSKQSVLQRHKTYSKKNKALVYGKLDDYWVMANKNYLDKIHESVELHGTFGATGSNVAKYIPEYVINHGVVSGTTIQNMLDESKVFVGLGFPYEGPAPLEAIANGAAFLNPKLSPPRDRYNSPFFKGKPTRRLLTSQNPYVEKFIGQPYVYTIDINNITEVEIAMRKIMNTTLKPYLPYEYTYEGTLERVSAQVEHLEFCHDSRWPPLRNMVTVKGTLGQSCEDACWKKGLLCEPSYWDILNLPISFTRTGISCDDVRYVEMTIAPSYEKETKTCHFQQQPLLYSCVSFHPSHIRLCPCRDFTQGQIALCKGCW